MHALHGPFLQGGGPKPPHTPALWDPRAGWVSHGELAQRVAALAAQLRRHPRSLAVLAMRNDVPSVVAYLAAIEAGHPLVLLDAAGRPELARRIDAQYAPTLRLTPGEAEVQLDVIGQPGRVVLYPQLALLLPTSGSTGAPKLVRLSRRNLEANAGAIASYLRLGPAERALAGLPTAYAYGLSVLNSHLWAGGSLAFVPGGVLDRGFWEAAERTACTSFAGVPYTYQVIERLGLARTLPRGLRTLTQAGGKLDPAIVQRLATFMVARGGRFVAMYGQTEATARMCYLPPDRAVAKAGSVGVPIPGGHVGLTREGEVVYHGPNVMLGYATCLADLALGDVNQGTLLTGDLGRLDAEGYLYVVGRKARFAKLFGMRIGLDEVEALLRPHGPVAVVDQGEALAIHCEFGGPDDYPALARDLARTLGVPAGVLRFQRVRQLPVLPSGKVDYEGLKAS